ncbi:MAG: cache domain-containing protein, partial [Burkholderiales bacterium]
MPPRRARPFLSRIPLGRALIALGLVLVAINVASAIWEVREARERTERSAQRDLTNITRVLTEQTAASLDAVDVVLRDLVRTGDARAVARSMSRLRDELIHMPAIATLLVLDAEGRMLANTGETPPVDFGLSRHPSFTVHRYASADKLHLSEPYPAAAEGTRWRFLLSRRLAGPGGRFGGVAVAAMEMQSFDRLYRSIDLGEGSFIALLSDAGVILSRVPAPPGVRGRGIPRGRAISAVQKTGRFEGWTESPITDQQVLIAALSVPGFPLFVASGRSAQAVLAPWRDEAWQVFDRTLLTSLAMLAL